MSLCYSSTVFSSRPHGSGSMLGRMCTDRSPSALPTQVTNTTLSAIFRSICLSRPWSCVQPASLYLPVTFIYNSPPARSFILVFLGEIFCPSLCPAGKLRFFRKFRKLIEITTEINHLISIQWKILNWFIEMLNSLLKWDNKLIFILENENHRPIDKEINVISLKVHFIDASNAMHWWSSPDFVLYILSIWPIA